MKDMPFPSHNGSRSTVQQQVGQTAVFSSFHPTMVLAQHAENTGGLRSGIRFPSHIGSRSTRQDAGLHNQSRSVSIPHWFSLNSKGGKTCLTHWCFHPTLVLAQPKCWRANTQEVTSFHPTLVLAQLFSSWLYSLWSLVSIPHWFSLNAVI